MFKVLAPIIGIIISVGLFFTYVQPTLDEVKAIQVEAAEYDEALTRASELRQRIAELNQRQSAISLAELERLEAFLPDRIDEVSVLIDIDALASARGLALSDIEVSDPPVEVQDQAIDPFDPSFGMDALGEGDIRSQYDVLDVGFSVTGTYEGFREFLTDLERSLVLMEVVEIAFTTTEEPLTVFNMKVRLYSLKQPLP